MLAPTLPERETFMPDNPTQAPTRFYGFADRTVHLMDGRIVTQDEAEKVGVRDPRVH
jgi:hypothetical protein